MSHIPWRETRHISLSQHGTMHISLVGSGLQYHFPFTTDETCDPVIGGHMTCPRTALDHYHTDSELAGQ